MSSYKCNICGTNNLDSPRGYIKECTCGIARQYYKKNDTLERIIKCCKKYHDNDCSGCPFEVHGVHRSNPPQINIYCDYGAGHKKNWNIEKIKELLDLRRKNGRCDS